MLKHFIIIIFTLAFWGGFITGQSAFAAEWNDKPVLCEETRKALRAIREKGETLIATGVQSAKVRNPDEADGLAFNPVHLATQIFVNLETKTFTIVEYHPSYGSVCILAFGDNFSSIFVEAINEASK